MFDRGVLGRRGEFRSQGAVRKIGGVWRDGICERRVSDGTRYVIFEITKGRYRNGGQKLVR